MKQEMNEELSKFGRLAEIAAAPSKIDPIIESFVRSFNAEVEKLPTPPPGYYYAPVDFQFKREGDNYTVEGEIGLRPIIEPKNEDSDETKRNNSTPQGSENIENLR